MSVSLNELSSEIRKNILKRNISTNSNEISIDTNTKPYTVENPTIEEIGDYYRNNKLNINYTSTSSSSTLIDTDYVKNKFSKSVFPIDDNLEIINSNNKKHVSNRYISSYYDMVLNEDAGKIQTLDSIGSILTGRGFSLNNDNSLDPNFDINSTLVGRVLGDVGVIDMTPITKFGNERLKHIFKERLLQNTQNEIFKKVNLDPISLIKGDRIIKPNYDITVGYNTLSKISETIGDVSGINLPINEINPVAELNKLVNSNTTTLTSMNNRILNTGRGQVLALFKNLKENKYIPAYNDTRTNDGPINGDKTTYSELVETFNGIPNREVIYSELNPTEGSILAKTKKVFESDNTKIKLDGFGYIQNNDSEVEQGVNFNGTKVISKGSGIKSREGLLGEIDPEKSFGRVFNVKRQNKFVNTLQKSFGLFNEDYKGLSVLGSNGFVKVGPKPTNNTKKYMFSIENLAWDGYTKDLPENEVGPGDLFNGTKGRIMWFPPYDITITDNSSVNIENTDIIGRGEPIYTYRNTERTGTLSFKLIIDHPSYVNRYKNVSDDILNSINAGTLRLDDPILKNMSVKERNEILQNGITRTKNTIDQGESVPNSIEINFEHNSSTFDDSVLNDIVEGLNNSPSSTIVLKGYYSSKEDVSIASDRVNSCANALYSKSIQNRIIISDDYSVSGCIGNEYQNDSPCISSGRKVKVIVNYNPELNENNINNTQVFKNVEDGNTTISDDIVKRYFNESLYFNELKQTDPLVYNSIKEKIKFFHPAFHSMTPEGFNNRLNFLMQCTRQGPTVSANNASNLSFGKPPVCILRVGDFYNTKIMFDNVSLSYEPITWDLNPEGVGVQPMICRVDLSFKIIGGSSMKGPINELQNAVSFNFFGNTELYDGRAKSIVKENGEFIYKSSQNITRDSEITVNDTEDTDELSKAESNLSNSDQIIENGNFNNIIINDLSIENDKVIFTLSRDVSYLNTTYNYVKVILSDGGVNQQQLRTLTIDDSNTNGTLFTINIDTPYEGMTNGALILQNVDNNKIIKYMGGDA